MTLELTSQAAASLTVGSTRFAEPFSASAPDSTRIGGKGASLARLVNLGYRVPPGFTLTVDAFTATLESLRLASLCDGLSKSMGNDVDFESASEIVKALLAGRVPDHVKAEIDGLTERLQLWRDSPDGLIVRSSATVEDSSALSFAGIFESISISHPEELEPTIRMVWSSVFARRALTYAYESGMRSIPRMAVVVQRFLQPKRSGVMFTRFPNRDGRSQVLVEHVDGDCEKLVKGEVTPDRLWLEPSGNVPDDLEGALIADHARELVRLAESLENDFGGPQDVEWCLFDDEVHVVQSRPITAISDAVPSIGQSAEAILSGVPASPGVGRGPAYLVFNIEQALRLSRGQVLVTTMTNPDMVVAMRNSTAIVTDVGGMICHAAIVSRELGLPCVVGTENATTNLRNDQFVTVDGSLGAVFDGDLEINEGHEARRMEWSDLWSLWEDDGRDRTGVVPVISSSQALEAAPQWVRELVLLPDVDLRATDDGLWANLEGLSPEALSTVLSDYLLRLKGMLSRSNCTSLYLLPPDNLSARTFAEVVEGLKDDRFRVLSDVGVLGRFDGDGIGVDGKRLLPLGMAALPARTGPRSITGIDEVKRAALDTIRFFGHRPSVRVAKMPDPSSRRQWWNLLPEYARFHQEYGTEATGGEFDWLEVRPELVISPLLKSLVQPGFEMVPRVMGFAGLPPMHIKWINCRYHFRSDTFEQVWRAIVHATWDEQYMTDLLRRVRASYEHLAEILVLFPSTEAELSSLTSKHIVALITSWWPRWVEFFALCWFIQAQGDDILFPFIGETVEANLAALGRPKDEFMWPGGADLVAPTTAVMSGEYMTSLAGIHDSFVALGVTETSDAVEAVESGRHPDISRQIENHIRAWGWLRDRDLLFEPWDTVERVVATAITTGDHRVSDYQENLHNNIAGLSFHYDLSHMSGRAHVLNFAVRHLHDLNVERENHHVLWLKYSYPLRKVILEVERRLVEAGSLDVGDVFFMQAPELIGATHRLPEPLTDEFVRVVRNRRAAYLKESRLDAPNLAEPFEEQDYY